MRCWPSGEDAKVRAEQVEKSPAAVSAAFGRPNGVTQNTAAGSTKSGSGLTNFVADKALPVLRQLRSRLIPGEAELIRRVRLGVQAHSLFICRIIFAEKVLTTKPAARILVRLPTRRPSLVWKENLIMTKTREGFTVIAHLGILIEFRPPIAVSQHRVGHRPRPSRSGHTQRPRRLLRRRFCNCAAKFAANLGCANSGDAALARSAPFSMTEFRRAS